MVAYSNGKMKFAHRMEYYQSTSFDPAYNLALEEFLFNRIDEEYLLIYRNQDAVICGKHQNPVAEISSKFLLENDIPLLRRFSGGGTVFHDLGNINFSFITSGESTKVIDFVKYANPVIDYLKSIGLHASLSERNDILLNGKKITGHAAHSKGNRALHHGTVLFNADLGKLSQCLKSNKDRFKSRAVKSVPSKVTNICDEANINLSVNEFISDLVNYLSGVFSIETEVQLSENDITQINTLVENKYRDWNWNFGYGPNYSFEIDEEIGTENMSVSVEVEKGIISKISFNESSTFDPVIKKLLGIRHDWREVHSALSTGLDKETANTLTHLLF